MSNQKPAIPMKNLAMFIVASVLIMFAWTYIENRNKKPPLTPEQKEIVREGVTPLGYMPVGHGLGDLFNFVALETGRNLPSDVRSKAVVEFAEAKKKEDESKPKPPPVPVFKQEFAQLGTENYFLQVRLTNKGGGVDRVILTHFPQADRNGREVKFKNSEGKVVFQPLHVVPSPTENADALREDAPPELRLPSFLIYHYASPDDPRPEPMLGERPWKLEPRAPGDDAHPDRQQVAYSTEVKELGVKFTKTFTLERNHYHVGLTLRIEPLAGAIPKPFRYQLAGGHGVPVEGIWYTGTFRNFIAGWRDVKGVPQRHFEDATEIHRNLGSDKEKALRGNSEFMYAACAAQYFASVTCIDDDQPKRDFIEYARATAEGDHPKDKPQFGDICPRMVSEKLTITAPVEHKYLLYHGPVKVHQLAQLRGDKAVPEDLIDRYENKLTLKTLTDYQSATWLGSFASAIYWTDLTIACTNLMHWVLGNLIALLPHPALAIILLTIMVRLALMPISRRQTASMQRMQEKMASMQPQLKRLEEEYKGRDQREFQQAKLKLMLENGINPAAQLGGCLLLFAQMPIFMGLYYALQENVFFRLESFLWIDNLAAPDMLFRWGEGIPFLSTPDSIGAFYYIGPYFNLLPLLAVTLMLIQQKFMTPPAADEQQAQQQKMMKWMLIVFGLVFYKTPSGLVLYFIISTLWALIERKLLPKKKPGELAQAAPSDSPETPPPNWMQRKMKELMEAAEKKDNTERRNPLPPRSKKPKRPR